MTACQEGHLEVVQHLVALGADLNAQNNVSDKFMLIYCGGDVYINKHSIDTALAHGNEFPSYYIFEKQIWNVLMVACYGGHLEVATYLVDEGLNVNAKNNVSCHKNDESVLL